MDNKTEVKYYTDKSDPQYLWMTNSNGLDERCDVYDENNGMRPGLGVNTNRGLLNGIYKDISRITEQEARELFPNAFPKTK